MTGPLQDDPNPGKSAILARHSIGEGDKLGEGDEAEAYALGPDRVLKLFKPAVDPLGIDRRVDFYASLDASAVAFAVPRIIERREENGLHYTIEARILGTSLIDALPRLDAARRRDAIVAYADAAADIARIGCPRRGIGELVAVAPLLAETWPGFVLARAEADLHRNRERVTVDRPGRAIDRMGRWLAERPEADPGLVHGDYYPANVMVDERGRVTGVIDFSGLTLFGDPRLDLAASLLHLTGMAAITMADRETVGTHLRGRGLHDKDLALYRLYYAFRFLDTPREGLFRWCLATIRAAC